LILQTVLYQEVDITIEEIIWVSSLGRLDCCTKNDITYPGLSLEGSILQKISEKDYLLNAPYQSYSYLIKFLREAALDPRLLPLKLLCTAAKNSQIISS
jgi:polyphosphate kinase